MDVADLELGSFKSNSPVKVLQDRPRPPPVIFVTRESSTFAPWSFEGAASHTSHGMDPFELISPLELPGSAFFAEAQTLGVSDSPPPDIPPSATLNLAPDIGRSLRPCSSRNLASSGDSPQNPRLVHFDRSPLRWIRSPRFSGQPVAQGTLSRHTGCV